MKVKRGPVSPDWKIDVAIAIKVLERPGNDSEIRKHQKEMARRNLTFLADMMDLLDKHKGDIPLNTPLARLYRYRVAKFRKETLMAEGGDDE